VARVAQDQGLTLPCDHDLFPLGEPLSLLSQVVDLPDMVALHVVVGATGFTRVREKPCHDGSTRRRCGAPAHPPGP